MAVEFHFLRKLHARSWVRNLPRYLLRYRARQTSQCNKMCLKIHLLKLGRSPLMPIEVSKTAKMENIVDPRHLIRICTINIKYRIFSH